MCDARALAQRGETVDGGVISVIRTAGGRGRAAWVALALRRGLAVAVLALGTSCATAPGVERLHHSSLGCMREVVATKVPRHISDKHAHCLAAGLIARYCSRPEAYVASWGKELTDLVDGSDDFEWADLEADRLGIACERTAGSDQALERCCVSELRRHHLPISPASRERSPIVGRGQPTGTPIEPGTSAP